ncbi:MAG: virulence protein [Sulfurospirillum sp.]|nr:virulence protein [Sulfurospirillum sp.]
MLKEKVKEKLTIYLLEKNITQMMFVFNIFQFIVIIILTTLLILLFPLKEKVPYLVNFSNAEQNFVMIDKAGDNFERNEATRISLVASYVTMRETKNNIDDISRTEKVRLQSNFSTWREFEKIFLNENSIFQKVDLKRSVNIINVSFMTSTIAQIDFVATIKKEGTIQSTFNFRAILKFKFDKQTLKFNEIHKNPTGFKVIKYSITRIN